ncbi:MAG: hypothetical protein EA379_01720 [Phycisphaerales bacterium]|nr:MAG: hypothetical protein EA379_01720 [Phycisphaerales bacterium]
MRTQQRQRGALHRRGVTGGVIAAGLLAALTLGLTLSGCAGGQRGDRDPMAVAADREAHTSVRVRAIEEVARRARDGEIDHERHREVMKRITWGAGNPSIVRIPAIDALLEGDEADTRAMLALMLPRETHWPVIEHISAVAVERGWDELTPAFVRSWSRVVAEPPDDQRPERAAILALNPGRTVDSVVFEVFATPNEDALFGERTRLDAWTLLCRLDSTGSRIRDLLRTHPVAPEEVDDPLLADLLIGARDLGAVPTTGEQLEWMRALRRPEARSFYEEAKAAVAGLEAEQLEGFELRHVSGVRWAARHRPAWMERSRAELLSEIRRRVAGRRVYERHAETVPGVRPPRETLDANERHFVWGDALLILIADEAIQHAGVVEALMTQADADRKDTTTEYGGVLDATDDGGFVALLYPPRPAQRLGDNRFVASPELLERGHTALFHYHFHARRADEREYAGPSPGDFEYAQRFGRSCMVFSSITLDILNADYFQPNGGRLDLGEIRRD